MAKYRKKLDLNEMSMSVTLKPKKNNMYKVTGVGKKMAAHGGIKKGEKFHDSEIDGMNDSGIKVKYQKPKLMKKESNSSMDQMADTYRDHEDHKDKKVQGHIKKAKKAYDSGDHEGFYNHTTNAADHAYKIRNKMKPQVKKEGVDPFADSITFNELEVSDWGDRTQDLQELSPQTVSSYQKKAGAQYRDLKKNTMSDASREAGYHKGYISDKEYDQQAGMADKKAKRGKGLAMSKGKGMKKEEMMHGEAYEKGRGPTGIAFAIPKGHPDAENPKTRKKYPERQTPEYKANFKSKSKKVFGESIQRRMDRKTIIATDPATGRKVVKIAPKKEIDVGKGKMESVVNEISDKMKMDYIKKAQKKVTGIEKMRDYQNKQMDKKPDSFSKSDKDFVNKKYDQDTLKRRQGMKMAASKLGEDMKPMKKPEYSNKEVRMGKGVAFDKRYKGGNMTGAYKTINKIKKGLGDHPKVADALRRANEEFTTKGE